MRFLSTAVLIFGLSSATCAIANPAGHREVDDLEARNVEAGDLQTLYEAYDLERREPATTRKKRPHRPHRPQRDEGCRKPNDWCTRDHQCCSNSCEPVTMTCD
ncbi:hypothetical protein LZ30DRAFT_744261 [Colletotrichum cereale]|nr:hypothetical protein LZ30DRAFT_744261 [Colletotrichum cereale]